VTLELYHELFEQTQTTRVPSLQREKDCFDFQCIYCGGEWSSKLRLSNHKVKGCEFVPFHSGMKNQILLPIFPNLRSAQMSKLMKRTMESNNGCALPFKLRTQLEIYAEHDLDKGTPKIGNHVDV
jgi:hypothetical protein